MNLKLIDIDNVTKEMIEARVRAYDAFLTAHDRGVKMAKALLAAAPAVCPQGEAFYQTFDEETSEWSDNLEEEYNDNVRQRLKTRILYAAPVVKEAELTIELKQRAEAAERSNADLMKAVGEQQKEIERLNELLPAKSAAQRLAEMQERCAGVAEKMKIKFGWPEPLEAHEIAKAIRALKVEEEK